jgi:ATP-dependent exoDNAse (exonuclease V) beta subunit
MIKSTMHNGLTCDFDDSNHSYTVRETGQILTSVTTLIKQYTPPFDAPLIAQQMIDKKKPKYAGMTVDEIQYQWKEKAELASLEGTELHALCERWPDKGCWGWLPKTYRLLKMGKQVDKLFPKLLERFRLVAAEQIVFSPNMGVAGQVDLIMADDATNKGIIIDWKTNSKITDEEGAFGTMLAPIDHLKNCDVVKYGLQLGLYEKILVDEKYYPEFDGYRKALVHVKESFGKVVKVGNYAEEIECLIRRIK